VDNGTEGRRHRFEEKVRGLEQPLYAAALRLTRNAAEAEDLVQETWYRAFRYFDQFQEGTNFQAWIFRIEMNIFRNRWRRKRMEPGLTDFDALEPTDREHSPELPFDPEQVGEMLDWNVEGEVKEAVESLSPELRSVLLLNSVGDLSYQETADALHIPLGTVMSRLHRARRRLRDLLAEWGAERRLGDASTGVA